MITVGLRAAQARCHTALPAPSRQLAGPAVLVLDEGLRTISRTAAAGAWLRILRPTATEEPQVPGYVYGLAGRLDAIDLGLETLPADLRAQTPDGACVTLRAARLEGHYGRYAITFEASSPEERIDVLGRAAGLSTRQRQLLGLAAAGLDTRELAERLFLSEHTVQQHFKAIFAKTGLNSRRRAPVPSRRRDPDGLTARRGCPRGARYCGVPDVGAEVRVVKRTVSPAVLAALLAALTVLCTTGVSPVHELGRAVGAASQPDRGGIAPGPAHVDRDVSTAVPVLRTVVRSGHAGGTTPYPGSALLPGAAALLVALLALGLPQRSLRLPPTRASHGVPPGRAPPFASGT